MRKKTDYRIEKLLSDSWFVTRGKLGSYYLFRDGKMRGWYKAIERYGSDYVNKETHFGSKSAASRALNRYLRGDLK